ncbi:MAG: hypothetical protein A2Y55_12545 [Actinobacteria bacterium RBG_16_68_12]|nr:MAG: hypothetical protein A2Y55_12545 [Actinobacteria bacterium RBG_16_68_12]
MANLIFGRDTELASISHFLERPGSARALVLRGEPGIGKTTLWRAAIARAAELGYQVRSTRPTESEANLSHMGLGDLFEGLSDEVLDSLPGPQRVALEVALLRAEAPDNGLDHRTVCVAFLAVLRSIAASDPLLLAIEDVQWLDGATGQVLGFVARRLIDERISFLATLRTGSGNTDPVEFVHKLGGDGVRTIDLTGISLDPLNAFLDARLQTRLPRPTVRRIHEASGGNAFFSLEIGRALLAGRLQLEQGRAIGLPADLADLLPNHLAELPSSTRELLLMCSAASTPTTTVMRSAVRDARSVSTGLTTAVAAGVIELEGDRIAFTHPLLASAVYSEATEDRRREVHRRLAEVITDPEERARHLALATEGPDLDVATALEQAAHLARRRGAPAAAADLCSLAVDVTPEEDGSRLLRLRMQAADCLLLAGDPERALAIVRPVAATEPPGPTRAEALWRKGCLLFWLNDFEGAADALAEALLQPEVASQRLSTIHVWRAWAVKWHDLREAERHAEEAVRLARLAEDPTVLALAIGALIAMRTSLGLEVPSSLLDEAMDLEEVADAFLFVGDRPSLMIAGRLQLQGDLDEARRICLRLLDEALATGDEISVADISSRMGGIERLAGNWMASLDHFARAAISPVGFDPSWQALVEALMGETARGAAKAQEALQSPLLQHDFEARIGALEVLGFIELSNGDPNGALEHLQIAWQIHQRWGIGEPSAYLFVADYAGALIELGRGEAAEDVLDWLEERGRTLDRPWALAVAARYRGLLAAARGDMPAALACLDDALKHHERLPMPFELGRTILVQGMIRRRAKQKRAAREALEQALEIFERLGAPLWADKARTEVARVSGRQPVRDELTPVERRIARLAAAGRTNREIAVATFLSVRTVEGHLSHMYAKLGIRSRTELSLFPELTDDPGPIPR